ncbi:hypothetical protein GDI55_22630 [Salmonella enterica subsp. enterica]|nr:hypothetical protein [Salmonella enterica subsp. enterica serovar Kambole]ECO3183976.1 hypothetical protein [Salmonella enterica subsp. enterica serovar Kambole]ECY5576750.1 hypothetical protein [Salmonella enterica subsp. enterica serovar Kambole]EDN3629708.1 hypothetical protein [Salmonella enterica subsp. enterica serovar Kambole]EIG0847587.1 hypothetical protein [Salmonella enterica subsp. enterica serovar Kambole]
MSKKARRSTTAQGYAGLTHAQFFHKYLYDDGTSEYKDLRYSLHGKMTYTGNGNYRAPLTRNQRRLYKKMYGTQPTGV